MDKQLKKVVKVAAAVVFVLALAINIKVTLDDPFLLLSDEAIAQQTSDNGSSNSSSSGGYSCTVTTLCGDYGSVSCTGTKCSRQSSGALTRGWVKCDGHTTYC